jgi:hypothetical protein
MNANQAISIIDGYEGEDDDDYYWAIQTVINAGMWSLPGRYGRAMMDAIRQGFCMLGPKPAADAYGSAIPSRDQVPDFSVGSRGYVEKRQGREWAQSMAEVQSNIEV